MSIFVDRIGDEFITIIRLDKIAGPGCDAVGYVCDFFETPFVATRCHDAPARIGKLNRDRRPDS